MFPIAKIAFLFKLSSLLKPTTQMKTMEFELSLRVAAPSLPKGEMEAPSPLFHLWQGSKIFAWQPQSHWTREVWTNTGPLKTVFYTNEWYFCNHYCWKKQKLVIFLQKKKELFTWAFLKNSFYQPVFYVQCSTTIIIVA